MVISMIQEFCISFFLRSELLDILPKNLIFLKNFNSEFLFIVVWFTNRNYKPLEIEDIINITLIIN